MGGVAAGTGGGGCEGTGANAGCTQPPSFASRLASCEAELASLLGVVDAEGKVRAASREPFNFTPVGFNSISPAHLRVRPMGHACR